MTQGEENLRPPVQVVRVKVCEPDGHTVSLAADFAPAAGGGRAIVLLHAIGMDHRMWDHLTPFLARQFRVVRVDVRGHGASPVPPRPYALEALAGDVAAVLDRLRIARAHLVGLSLGGMIGQAFALEHADRDVKANASQR